MIDYFTEILLGTVQYRLEIILWWMIILTLVFCSEFIILFVKVKCNKNRESLSKSKEKATHTEFVNKRKKILFRCVIGYTLMALLFIFWVLPPYKDAINFSIIEINTIYSRDNRDYHWLAPNIGGEVSVLINDKQTRMELYPGFSQIDFPEGVFHAKVWYAKESKIILDVDLLDN